MKPDFRTRLGFWLERFTWLHRWLLEFDGIAPSGFWRCINRVNGHVVLTNDRMQIVTPGERAVPMPRPYTSQQLQDELTDEYGEPGTWEWLVPQQIHDYGYDPEGMTHAEAEQIVGSCMARWEESERLGYWPDRP